MFFSAGDIPAWGQYGAVGILLVAAVVWWRYSIAAIAAAQAAERSVWERITTTVLPVLGRAVSSADLNATTTERVIRVMEDAVSVIKSERSAKELAEQMLLEERLRVATLRAELAEQKVQRHGGG
jgi:hypothetical protein